MFTVEIVRRRRVFLPTVIIGPKHVNVGFPAGSVDQDNINHAFWNEFGTRGGATGGGWGGPVPERPFMRNAIRNNRDKYRSAMRINAVQILRGSTSLVGVMRNLGVMAQASIQAEIMALSSPPNAPVTIARKGSSKPLIDTGAMHAAVTFKVDT